jgi:hypothetical protein
LDFSCPTPANPPDPGNYTIYVTVTGERASNYVISLHAGTLSVS